MMNIKFWKATSALADQNTRKPSSTVDDARKQNIMTTEITKHDNHRCDQLVASCCSVMAIVLGLMLSLQTPANLQPVAADDHGQPTATQN